MAGRDKNKKKITTQGPVMTILSWKKNEEQIFLFCFVSFHPLPGDNESERRGFCSSVSLNCELLRLQESIFKLFGMFAKFGSR